MKQAQQHLISENLTILLYSAKLPKEFGSEIRKLRAFEDSDCTVGARIRKTAGARSCCIPELLALKGLSLDCGGGAESRWRGVAWAGRVLEDEPQLVGEVGSGQRPTVVSGDSQQQSSVHTQTLQEAGEVGGALLRVVLWLADDWQVALQSNVPQARNDETPRPHGDIQRTQQEENEEAVGEEGQPFAVRLSIEEVQTWIFVSCCFASTETARLIRDGEPKTATSTFTQLLSSDQLWSALYLKLISGHFI